MIVLYRVSSIFSVVIVALGFSAIILGWLSPPAAILLTLIILSLLLARLLKWEVQTFQFWHLLGTPVLFVISSMGVLLFFETLSAKWILAVLTTLLLFVFTELVFSYIHLPSTYQPFTLEYLSQLLHTVSIFFTAAMGFGVGLFLQVPLWVISLGIFLISFFVVFTTLWVGKIDLTRAQPYALAGAVLTTEFFVALSFLPTGFYTNAAFLALVVYVFLGLSRAHAQHKLSKDVLRRYLVLFFLLAIIIAASSQWL